MPDRDDRMTEETKQLYRKARVPHKFCPYCGTRNEADAQKCAECGKDISWMRVPEPMPYDQAPAEPPRSLPEQQKIFTPRVIIVIVIIAALLIGFVLVLVFATRGKGAEFTYGVTSGVRHLDVNGTQPMGSDPVHESAAPAGDSHTGSDPGMNSYQGA